LRMRGSQNRFRCAAPGLTISTRLPQSRIAPRPAHAQATYVRGSGTLWCRSKRHGQDTTVHSRDRT
jgi:hypothetical protein